MVKKITEEEEVTEVVEVSSRKVSSQLEFSSGRPGGLEVASTQEESQQPKDEVADANGEGEAEEENQENGDKQVDERATKIEVKDEKKKRRLRGEVGKPQESCFEDERNLEGLWKAAFPVGTEWDQLDALYEFNWDFKHLEEALEEEDGLLYGKKVFLLVVQNLVPFKGVNKILHVPAVVAVESPFPPSDKIGITSVQRSGGNHSMKTMKMDWLPYIPVDKEVDKLIEWTFKFLSWAVLGGDFYQPFKEEELEQSTEVQIMFPSEPPVVCEFDWELDELEEFVDKLIEEEALTAEQRMNSKNTSKSKYELQKKANRGKLEARRKAIEEMSEETKQAFQSMKFYKFYPLPSPETPDVSGVKSPFINRYYGKAHESPIIIKS
ncbi:hypothetical protein Bca52824_021509 [Brassica carinata]|uniref:Uncharacterized protein n=1 Tax=Brassica carinata TaxID=52824 RepID=A0A8X8ARW6_BRACI|nr:hypothetical protein Bca52824_021509 [Brassica carinata]